MASARLVEILNYTGQLGLGACTPAGCTPINAPRNTYRFFDRNDTHTPADANITVTWSATYSRTEELTVRLAAMKCVAGGTQQRVIREAVARSPIFIQASFRLDADEGRTVLSVSPKNLSPVAALWVQDYYQSFRVVGNVTFASHA